MADKVVEIPGVGNVAFPDTMSDAEINAAAAKAYQEKQGAFGVATTVNGQRIPADSPLDLLKGAFSTLNPIPAVQAVGQALPIPKALGGGGVVEGPTNAVKSMLAAQGDVAEKGNKAFKEGDYLTAARHYVDWLLPVIGPAIDQAADKMAQGQPWRGAGEAIGLGLGLTAPEAVSNLSLKMPALARNPNPAEAAAADFGQVRGIPVDAGTATGNRFIKGVQVGADNTPIGGIVATRAKQAQGEALSKVGSDLASDVLSVARTPEQAGARMVEDLTSRIQAHAQYADHAYDQLRQLEASPRFQRTIQTGTKTVDTGVVDASGQAVTRTQPVTETIALPVDLRAPKASLKPLYDQLTRQYSVTQAEASAGYKALGNIVHGPDYAPLSQVETDLGAIKSIARGADLPELRTQSQGLAASGVNQLQAAVDRTAAQAGPDVQRALVTGRAATAAKYQTADVLDGLRAEPVQAYRQAVAPKDSGIARLRTIAQQTPTAVPDIGRAWLDDALSKATAEGGFEKGARLAADWQNLGPQTKQILFGADGTTALDKYFLLAKKLAESPNPSGTALTGTAIASGGLIFTNPALGVPLTLGAGALAKIARNPTAVKLLTKGLTLSLGPGRMSKAAQAMGVANVFEAARVAGVLGLTPATADQTGAQP